MAASEELLGFLHDAVAQDLLKKVRSGEASSADISAAIKFLKDNGIEAVADDAENPLNKLAGELPEFTDEEPLHVRH